MDPILDGLNEEQKKAVLYTDGPLLVLAGAGSGKTRVITHRFAYLMREKQLYAGNILAVTFTNKAAAEMKERITQLTGENMQKAWVRTFHSMGVMLLRQHAERLGYDKNFVIYDDVDSKNLIKGILKELKIDLERYTPRGVASQISKARDAMISPANYADEAAGDFQQTVAKVYELYNKRIRKNNAMDFPDLIGLQVVLFRDHPDILSEYRRKWRYVMVDEFQDTNFAQYELVKLIVNDQKNICVVGDDDQSIYGWRGANIDNIYDFRDSFQPTLVSLERNYRSTSVILEAANEVVTHISGRMEKRLWTNVETTDKITLIETYTDREEAATIVSEIERLSARYSYKDFAVFYRTNAQSRVLEEALMRLRIPYKVFGGQKFYERKEVKDILSYLKLIVNPVDANAFDRIVNVPKRKVGEQTRGKIKDYAESNHLNYIEVLMECENVPGISAAVKASLKNLGLVLHELHESIDVVSPLNFTKILLESIEYENYILTYDQDGRDRWANVEELANSVRNFQEFNPEATIVDFLSEISLETASDSLDGDEKRDYVSLMTIHNAKGLEFPVVFITGTVEGLIPLVSYSADQNLDEERRLFYVAITRAKQKLFISHSETRMTFGQIRSSEPSSFLKDIPQDLLEPMDARNSKQGTSNKRSETRGGKYSQQNKSHSSDSKYQKYPKKSGATNRASKHTPQTRKERENAELPTLQGSAVQDIMDLKEGDKVGHALFGTGEVVFVSERILKVSFDRIGHQILSAAQVNDLVKIS